MPPQEHTPNKNNPHERSKRFAPAKASRRITPIMQQTKNNAKQAGRCRPLQQPLQANNSTRHASRNKTEVGGKNAIRYQPPAKHPPCLPAACSTPIKKNQNDSKKAEQHQNGKNHELWGIKPPTAVKSKRIAVIQQNAYPFKKQIHVLAIHVLLPHTLLA